MTFMVESSEENLSCVLTTKFSARGYQDNSHGPDSLLSYTSASKNDQKSLKQGLKDTSKSIYKP